MRRFLLPISLSLNMFLAVVVGTLVLRDGGGRRPPPDPSRIVEEVAAILPPADADVLRQTFSPRIAASACRNGVRPRGRAADFPGIIVA